MGDSTVGEDCLDGSDLLQRIRAAIAANAGRHPGIIAEAVVELIASTFELTPRETHHPELRKNHRERVRRLSHEVYRVLAGAREIVPEREIAARVHGAFHLARRSPATATPPAAGP